MQGLLEPFAQVQYLDASCITREAVSNAHALLVRTRTRCNEQLLAGSSAVSYTHLTLPTKRIV